MVDSAIALIIYIAQILRRRSPTAPWCSGTLFKMLEENDPQPEEAPPAVAQTVIGASVVLLIVFGLILTAWPAARRQLWTQEAAAWIQAIGSVAAIGTAVWLAHAQAERERKKRECEEYERRVRNTSVALAAIQYIRYVTKGIQKDLAQTCGTDETPTRTDVMAHRIQALRSFAERLDVAQLDNARIAPRYFGVLEAVVALDAAYVESAQRALNATKGVLEICRRFSYDFGGAGVHTVLEFVFLPEFQDQ